MLTEEGAHCEGKKNENSYKLHRFSMRSQRQDKCIQLDQLSGTWNQS
jgi:hypothetical protein